VNPKSWKRAREIVEGALELEPPQRGPFVERAAEGDAELARAALELLREVEVAETDGDWPRPPDAVENLAAGRQGDDTPPRQVGDWVLGERIGAGGMGTVYRALRTVEGIEQRAAVKLLKRGLDTEELLKRFRREGQVLARLEHPNIARLIDGGASDDGRPFLAMEFVEGDHVHRWCDARELAVPARVELFREVCGAVHFAHTQLVVHRDLKPSNILVDGDGRPRLLDFGVAKVLRGEGGGLQPDVLITDHDRPVPMTPEYASPEQVRGETVGTATDVYSLGAVLYQLLTGQRAHRFVTRSPKEVEQAICKQSPAQPSQAVVATRDPEPSTDPTTSAKARGTSPRGLARQLSGDLDWIVMKALHKEPSRRYGSVEQFAEDLERFLTGRPVLARPDSWIYRARRSVARNRWATMGALALAGTVSLSWWNSERLHGDVTAARTAAEDVGGLAMQVIGEVTQELNDLPGSLELRARLVAGASARLEPLVAGGSDPALLLELASTYLNLGAMQGGNDSSSLGQYEQATLTLIKVDSLLGKLEGVGPAHQLTALNARRDWLAGLLLDHQGDTSGAIELLQRAVSGHPTLEGKWRELHSSLALRLSDAGWYDEALVILEQVTAFARERFDQAPDVPRRSALAAGLLDQGHVLRNLERFDQSETILRESRGLYRELLEEFPADLEYRTLLASAEQKLGVLLTQTGRAGDESEALLIDAAAELERQVALNPRWLIPRDGLISALFNLGEHAIFTKQYEAALEFHSRGEAACLARLEVAPGDLAERQLASARDRMGYALNELGRVEEAREVLAKAKAFFVERAAESDAALAKRDLAVSCYILGASYRVAANGSPPPAGYVENLEAAYDEWYQCVDLLLELDRSGQLMERDRGQLEHLQEELLDIEARLIAAEDF